MNFTYTFLSQEIVYESASCPDCDWKFGPVPLDYDSTAVLAAEAHRLNTGHSPDETVNVRITPGPKDPDHEDAVITPEQMEKIRHLWEEEDDDDED